MNHQQRPLRAQEIANAIVGEPSATAALTDLVGQKRAMEFDAAAGLRDQIHELRGRLNDLESRLPSDITPRLEALESAATAPVYEIPAEDAPSESGRHKKGK